MSKINAIRLNIIRVFRIPKVTSVLLYIKSRLTGLYSTEDSLDEVPIKGTSHIRYAREHTADKNSSIGFGVFNITFKLTQVFHILNSFRKIKNKTWKEWVVYILSGISLINILIRLTIKTIDFILYVVIRGLLKYDFSETKSYLNEYFEDYVKVLPQYLLHANLFEAMEGRVSTFFISAEIFINALRHGDKYFTVKECCVLTREKVAHNIDIKKLSNMVETLSYIDALIILEFTIDGDILLAGIKLNLISRTMRLVIIYPDFNYIYTVFNKKQVQISPRESGEYVMSIFAKLLFHSLQNMYVAIHGKTDTSRAQNYADLCYSNELQYRELPKVIFYNEALYKLLHQVIRNINTLKLKRNILIKGQMGIGKTSAIFKLMENMSDRIKIQIIDKSYSAALFVLNMFKGMPKVIIIEDVEKTLLDCKENTDLMKILDSNESDIVIMTCNNIELPEAIKRPGRIDMFIELKPFTVEELEYIYQGLSKVHHIHVSKSDVQVIYQKLVENKIPVTPAFAKNTVEEALLQNKEIIDAVDLCIKQYLALHS